MKFKHKILATLGIIILVFVVACIFFASRFTPATEFTWGINFSQDRARELGFDARQMFLDILTDLHPKKIRLSAYWNLIEPQRDKYDFAETDDLIKLAQDHNAEVILVVGKKQPRWPECHQPGWVNDLSVQDAQQAQLDMIKQTIEHFKTVPAIKVWQVENEALFGFGLNCPKLNRDFLKSEVALVQSLDSRPVLVTDSGELGRWVPAATVGEDIFGTTMYRVVHDPRVGYFKYPLSPTFFHIKAGILKTFTNLPRPIGVELQAEPWLINTVESTDLNTQQTLMNPKIFAENVEYAKEAGFSENYLWGAEWWYWMAKKHNDWGMWAAAKDLLAK